MKSPKAAAVIEKGDVGKQYIQSQKIISPLIYDINRTTQEFAAEPP